MTTFAVTVTYGNRFHLLKQVIDSALAEGVAKIIVVDNNSQPESREKLKAYEQELGSNKIKVLYLDDNYGSAGGFKRGLKEANSETTDFIWLLDDDNVPQDNSLNNLIKTKECFDNKNIILVSYRKIMDPATQQIVDKDILYSNVSIGEVLGEQKSFFSKLVSKLSLNKKNHKLINFPIARREHGSYGGMFFEKSVLENVGYPNEEFYLYADDIEYSQRLQENGYLLYTCYFSQIVDIDVQLGSTGYFFREQSDIKIYYSIRNHTFLQRKNHSKIYFFLKFSMLIIKNLHKIKDTSLFISRFKLIKKAYSDGVNGRVGRQL